MKISEKLTKELISQILSNLGIVTPPLFGKSGITEDHFKSGKEIKIKYEDNVIDIVPVYSGTSVLGKSKIRALSVCLHDEGIYELALVIKVDDLYTYGLRQSFDSNDPGIFLASKNDGTWHSLNTYEKLMVCAGIEVVTDRGAVWVPEADVTDLYDQLLQILDM